MSKTHELKTWPEFYSRVAIRQKDFDVRKNDRDFQVGDILRLREYDPETNLFTGLELEKEVSYILHGGQFGIEAGYCVMGLSDPINI